MVYPDRVGLQYREGFNMFYSGAGGGTFSLRGNSYRRENLKALEFHDNRRDVLLNNLCNVLLKL